MKLFWMKNKVLIATLCAVLVLGVAFWGGLRLFAGNQMCRVSSEEEKKLRCGSSFPTSLPDGDYRVYGESGAFLMLGRAEDGRMRTVKSFFEV